MKDKQLLGQRQILTLQKNLYDAFQADEYYVGEKRDFISGFVKVGLLLQVESKCTLTKQ